MFVLFGTKEDRTTVRAAIATVAAESFWANVTMEGVRYYQHLGLYGPAGDGISLKLLRTLEKGCQRHLGTSVRDYLRYGK